MRINRRKFLKNAGTVGTLTAVGAAVSAPAEAQTAPAAQAKRPRGMAKALTLLTMRVGGVDRLGVKTERGILNVSQASALLKMYAPVTMDDLLQNEDGPAIEALVKASLASNAAQAAFTQESTIEYGPLVGRPEKIVCVGLNYANHAKEVGQPIPKYPVLFNKFNTTLNRHKGTIKLPTDLATQFDYEVELVIVMGRAASKVREADALSYVAGYATGNDFTARDLQNGRGGQWMIGKTVDQFAPIGPYLVTADQVDPDKLAIELPRQRRETAVIEHVRLHRQHAADDQLHLRLHHAEARRRDLHRHARGRDSGHVEGQAGVAEAGRSHRVQSRKAW